MPVADLIAKGLAGGLLTVAIVLASRSGNVLPGILPLAPTFAVIALLAVGAKGDAGGLRETCLAGMKTIPAYLAFLAACWMLAGRMDFRLVIGAGLLAWALVAGVIFFASRAG